MARTGIIAELETALVERLAARLPELAAEAFPKSWKEYRLLHQRGAVLVMYRSSRYGQIEDVGAVVQERTAEFALVLLARNLRDHRDLSGYLEGIRRAVQGFKVPGCRAFRMVDDRFEDEVDGLWTHAVLVDTVLPAVEDNDEEELPPLTRVEVDGGQYGSAEAPPAAE